MAWPQTKMREISKSDQKEGPSEKLAELKAWRTRLASDSIKVHGNQKRIKEGQLPSTVIPHKVMIPKTNVHRAHEIFNKNYIRARTAQMRSGHSTFNTEDQEINLSRESLKDDEPVQSSEDPNTNREHDKPDKSLEDPKKTLEPVQCFKNPKKKRVATLKERSSEYNARLEALKAKLSSCRIPVTSTEKKAKKNKERSKIIVPPPLLGAGEKRYHRTELDMNLVRAMASVIRSNYMRIPAEKFNPGGVIESLKPKMPKKRPYAALRVVPVWRPDDGSGVKKVQPIKIVGVRAWRIRDAWDKLKAKEYRVRAKARALERRKQEFEEKRVRAAQALANAQADPVLSEEESSPTHCTEMEPKSAKALANAQADPLLSKEESSPTHCTEMEPKSAQALVNSQADLMLSEEESSPTHCTEMEPTSSVPTSNTANSDEKS